jgi:hypothetical protein
MTRFRAERPVRPLRRRVGSADLTRRTDQRSLNRRQRISLMLAVRTGDAWTQRAHHDRLIGTKTRRVGWAAGQLERLRTVSLYPGLGLLVGSDGLRCIRCQGPRRASQKQWLSSDPVEKSLVAGRPELWPVPRRARRWYQRSTALSLHRAPDRWPAARADPARRSAPDRDAPQLRP